LKLVTVSAIDRTVATATATSRPDDGWPWFTMNTGPYCSGWSHRCPGFDVLLCDQRTVRLRSDGDSARIHCCVKGLLIHLGLRRRPGYAADCMLGSASQFNPLNAELNPICHLLGLLEDLTFMGPCIISIFQYTCICNKMQRCTVYLYLETALHVSGGTSTHHLERIHLYLQHLVLVTALLLSAAFVEELELV
jgi:hypothetical protein